MTNEIEVKPEIENISRERHAANLNREIKSYKDNIERHEDSLKRLHNDKANLKKKYEIIRANFKMLRPTWEYETTQEYLKCCLFDLEAKEWQDGNLFERNEEQIKATLEHQRTAMKSVVEELIRIEGEDKK